MKKRLNFIFLYLKIIIFLKNIMHSLLQANKNLLDNIIIFENTNGDIYLSQNYRDTILIFGTTLSNKEQRIFYGITDGNNNEEKYIFLDEENNEYIPYIIKSIGRNENKEITNAQLGVLKTSKDTIILLIGTDDSYIEAFNLNEYTKDINIFLPSDFFISNITNKGISSLVSDYSSNFNYISSSILNNDTSKYYIAFHQYYFSTSSGDNSKIEYILSYHETFSNIKGDYMNCFGYYGSHYYFSCFYLDINNNYQINFIVEEGNKFLIEGTIQIYTPNNINDDEYYFLKGVSVKETTAAYVYYSGENNNIPTLIIKTIVFKIKNVIDFSFTDKYDDYPVVYLYDYDFNNGIKYNDLVANEMRNTYLDIFFVSTNPNKEYIIIAYLIFYTSSTTSNTELLIRYFTVKLNQYYNMNIFHGFKVINFSSISYSNRYLTIAFDFCLSDTCENLDYDKGNSALILFSYPNKTNDINIDFIEYALNYNRKYIITNLTENFVINNNIFGYSLDSFFITEMSDDYFEDDSERNGIEYTVENEGTDLHVGSFPAENSLVRIDFTNSSFEELLNKEIYIKYRIKLSPENNLTKFNSYWDKYNDTFGNISDSNSNKFESKTSIISILNISISDEMTSINCSDISCSVCLTKDLNYCLICENDNYKIINDKNYKYGKLKLCQKDVNSEISNEFIDSTEISTTEVSQNKYKYSMLEDMMNNKYIYIDLSNEEIKIIYEEIKNYMREKYDGKEIILNSNNVKIQISSLDSQKNSKNFSNIDLLECGEKLKSKYCKNENDSLIMLKFDIKKENEKSTYVEFEIYDHYIKTKLDLNECLDDFIFIDIPISFDSNIELLYDLLAKSGYNLFNENNSFYNDICTKYTTENGTDILIYDRRMDIYQSTINISLCQEGCQFQSYEINSKKAKCQCSIKSDFNSINKLDLSDIKFDSNEMVEEFKKVLYNSNFRVLK